MVYLKTLKFAVVKKYTGDKKKPPYYTTISDLAHWVFKRNISRKIGFLLTNHICNRVK